MGRFKLSAHAYCRLLTNAHEYSGDLLSLISSDYRATDHIITGKGYAWGAGAMLARESGRLTGWASYSFGVSRLQFNTLSHKMCPSSFDPGHSLTIFGRYRLSRWLDTSASWHIASGRRITPITQIYIIADKVMMEHGGRNGAITTSVTPLQHKKPITDSFIRWGKVTVSDGDTAIILTGAPDYDVFPPFVYRTYEMTGCPGKRYTITAEYRNMSVESTATMLSPTPIDSIEFAPIIHSDSLCATFLHFTTAADVPAYYVIQSRSVTRGTAFRPSMLGTFVAESPRTHFRMQVYRAESDIDQLYSGVSENLSLNFIEGEQIAVKLCRVSKEIYDFWAAFDNNAIFGENRFVSGYAQLPSNVAGGYGVCKPRAQLLLRWNREAI